MPGDPEVITKHRNDQSLSVPSQASTNTVLSYTAQPSRGCLRGMLFLRGLCQVKVPKK